MLGCCATGEDRRNGADRGGPRVSGAWPPRPVPIVGAPRQVCWRAEPGTLAELTLQRVGLRATLQATAPLVGEDELEWLLLVVEELASNGLRHGRPPVTVAVAVSTDGWLVSVTDAAVDRPPVPAVGRDAAYGGLGLPLVSRLSTERGWCVDGPRKHVWALVDRVRASEPV